LITHVNYLGTSSSKSQALFALHDIEASFFVHRSGLGIAIDLLFLRFRASAALRAFHLFFFS